MAEHPEHVEPDRPTRDEIVEPIIARLTDAAGGIEAVVEEKLRITELNGNLIIKATAKNHARIATVLEAIRRERMGLRPVAEDDQDGRSVDPHEARAWATQESVHHEPSPRTPARVSVLFDPNPLPRLLEVMVP